MRAGLSHRPQLLIVALMLAFSVMDYFNRTIMSIAGPEIMKELHVEPTQMGVVYSGFLLSYSLFMIPGGHLVDMIGPRRALMLVGFGTALFTGLTAVGGSVRLGAPLATIWVLAAIRFLMGILTSPLYPACGRMCANWISAIHLGKVQGIIIGGSSLGGAIAPILFQTLMSGSSWQTPFILAAITTAVVATLWLLAARDRPSGSGTQPPRQKDGMQPSAWRRLLTNRNLLLLTAAYAALGYFSYIFYYWIYYYFGEIRQMGYSQSARFTTIVFIVNGLMIPLGGWLSDRLTNSYGEQFGRRVVPIGGLCLSAVLLCAGTMTGGTWSTVLFMAFAMGFASVCEGPFWALTITLGREQAGAAGSILNTGSNLAGFVAPVLTPLIASRAGWSWGLYFGCFIILLGAVACLLVDVRKTFASR